MPSVELELVPGWILTPRDFDEFRREVKLYEEKLYSTVMCNSGYHEMKRYIRVEHRIQPELPTINWIEHKSRYRSQVIRHNCNNTEYEKFLLSGKRKMTNYTDDVFLPN